METRLRNLKARLDECESWPCDYVFKFIVPASSAGDMAALLAGFEYTARQSSAGKYLSYTVNACPGSSEEVIALYRAALGVPGCIAL